MDTDERETKKREDEAKFLRMCVVAASPDSGGQWTDEKIEAVEALQADPRGVVLKLLEVLRVTNMRAETAERKLGMASDDIDTMTVSLENIKEQRNASEKRLRRALSYAEYCWSVGQLGDDHKLTWEQYSRA